MSKGAKHFGERREESGSSQLPVHAYIESTGIAADSKKEFPWYAGSLGFSPTELKISSAVPSLVFHAHVTALKRNAQLSGVS